MGKKIKKSSGPSYKPQDEKQEAHHSHIIDKKSILALLPQQQLDLIKDLLQQILLEPETQFKQVESIFILAKSSNVQIATTALRVLGEVFVGVAPLESVDLKQIEERKAVKITKEQFKVLRFEETLVAQYERYLKMLKEINSKLVVNDFAGDEELFREFKKCLLQSVIKCFQTLWNFNHFSLLSDLITRFCKYQPAQNAISAFLADKNISTFKAKAKVIADISSLIKERPQNSLPDELIKIVNSTFVDFKYLQKEADSLKFQKKKMTKKLYKQKALEQKKDIEKKKQFERGSLELKAHLKKQKAKQKMKVKEEVQKEFAQGQATLKKKELIKFNSLVLQEIYYIYFKILVERPNSKYLPDVLEGILTFAHLINIDLTSALINHLQSATEFHRQAWLRSRNHHVLQSRIRIAFTAESLLNGPLAVYNMDDLKATTALFKIFRDINDNSIQVTREEFRMLGASLEESLLKRRQLSQEVVASLLREIVRLLTHKEVPKLYLLQLVRTVASKYSRVSRMFEEDNEGYGLYGFNPHSLDPQSTNAINTELVTALEPFAAASKKTKDPYNIKVAELTQRLLRQTFTKIQSFSNIQELLQEDLNRL